MQGDEIMQEAIIKAPYKLAAELFEAFVAKYELRNLYSDAARWTVILRRQENELVEYAGQTTAYIPVGPVKYAWADACLIRFEPSPVEPGATQVQMMRPLLPQQSLIAEEEWFAMLSAFIVWVRKEGQVSSWQTIAVSVPAGQTNPRPVDDPADQPEKPQTRRLEDWFDWYHAMHAAGFKCTLPQIAELTGYARGTVKQEHALYMAERKDEPNA